MATENTPLVAANGDSQPLPATSSWGKSLGMGGVVLLLIGAAFYGGMVANSSGDASLQEPTESPRLHVQEVVGNDDFGTRIDDDEEEEAGAVPSYVGTQFISFTINTIGGVADKGECKGQPVDPHNGFCYLGNADNITEDIFHRLEIVEQVLSKIKQDAFSESPDIDHADDVLKIVMIPEFFWRGPNGAYSTDILLPPETIFMKLSDRLRAMVADDFFNDFLFVFGTAIAADTPKDPRKPWEGIESAKDVEYYNFATVHKGGAHHHHRYAVTKKYISGADFLSRTTLPNPKEENKDTYGIVSEELSKLFASRNITLITDNILELDGLRIGLEICLDHRMGALWNQIKTHKLPLVDILLVTSAGMAIERGPNPIVPGGVVYLCDGDASSAACLRTDNHKFHPEAVCRGDVGGLKHIPVGGPGCVALFLLCHAIGMYYNCFIHSQCFLLPFVCSTMFHRYTSFFPLSACWDMEDSELLKGYYSLYQPQGCAFTLSTYDIDVMDEFAYYPPSIEIYPTVKLADSTYH